MTDIAYCKKIQKKHGKSYYFSTRFFPRKIRFATYAFYAWVRKLDDIVDETINETEKRTAFDAWTSDWQKCKNGQVVSRPEMRAFIKVVRDFNIKEDYLSAFIYSMRMDLDKKRYETYAELKDYMYGSATVIGLVMMQITGGIKDEGIKYAEALGEAMQLTNFLRDIKDDFVKRDRIYMPKEELMKFGLSFENIKNQNLSKEFVKFKIFQAKELYRKAMLGLRFVPKKSKFPIKLSLIIYSKILDKIEQNDYNVFEKRAKVSRFGKIFTLFKTILWEQKNI
jgi:phytoene synthase